MTAIISLINKSSPLIYLISDGTLTEDNFVIRSKQLLELAATAAALKISFIQIREKKLTANKIYLLARQIAAVTRRSQTKLMINDRADIALAAGADGVQLTGNSLSAATIRQNFPANFIIGVSAHDAAEVERAHQSGATFATFSPIFFAPSKVQYNLPPQGIEKLREVCQRISGFPVLALGGIDETNFPAVLAAGASGFAAIRLLNNAERLPGIIKSIRNE